MSSNEEFLNDEQAAAQRQLLQDCFDYICYTVDAAPNTYPELSRLLSDSWRSEVQSMIDSIQADEPFPDSQLQHLLSALAVKPVSYLGEGNSPYHIGIDILEDRLRTVGELVRKQGKTKAYKSTFQQLVADNANQFHAALFEITVLSALGKIDPDLNLFPPVGQGARDVEAAIDLEGRPIYCECSARGYSPTLDHRQGVVDPC